MFPRYSLLSIFLFSTNLDVWVNTQKKMLTIIYYKNYFCLIYQCSHLKEIFQVFFNLFFETVLCDQKGFVLYN